MTQSAKHFSERLNRCLDETGVPASTRARAAILSRMLDIPKQQAWSFVEGHQLPDPKLLQKIASEFEVDTKWLSESK